MMIKATQVFCLKQVRRKLLEKIVLNDLGYLIKICTYIYRVYKKFQTENLMQLRYSKIFKISFASIGELGHDWYI